MSCGFTPINQRVSLPSYSTPVGGVDSRVIQEDELPNLQPKAATRSKKRTASHLSTASVATKKPRKVSQPRKSKVSEKASDLSNREISQAFVQSKPAYRRSLSIEADSKVSDRNGQEVTVQVQSANVGARVSSPTMRKLDAFRFQAGDQTRHHEGLSYTSQDAVVGQPNAVAESTCQLDEGDMMEIHEEFTDQDDRAQTIFQQDTGSGQGTHEYSFQSTCSPERSPNIVPYLKHHKSADGKRWLTTSNGISSKEAVGKQARCNVTASSSALEQTFPEFTLEAPPRKSHVSGALRDTALCETTNFPEDDDIYAGLTPQETFSPAKIGTVNHCLDQHQRLVSFF